MADNVTFQTSVATPPDATVIATDDVSGAQYQRIKVDGGGNGVSVPIEAGQQLAAASLPVVIASDQSAVPISGTVTATVASTTITGNVTVVQPTGTNLHVVTDSGTITTVGAVTAITNALPAGSNVIGHVIADTGSTTAVTGNVTVVQPTGTNLHTVIDSGTLTTVSTVTAVTAITNALPAGSNVIGHVITDSGSTTAVTGTVTVSGAVTEATLDAALIAQEATTSGIKGLTAFGAVTTAAPTYTTAKSDALSLQTNGSLRTAITDALPAGTAVIGHVIADSGSTTAVTGNVAITAASGAIASGALASGSVASGAFASGSIASGALASGSIAVGAIAAGATSIADNEDAASVDGDRGVKVLAVRKATPANTSGSDGDYEFFQMSGGRLWVWSGIQSLYGGKVTLTTTNWVSLANGSGWQSVAVATSGCKDVHIWLQSKSTGTTFADFYIATKLSNGTGYTDGATGTEGTFTAANRQNSRYLGSLKMNNASEQVELCLSDIFSGAMPANFAIIGINNTGATISSTAGDTVFEYELVN